MALLEVKNLIVQFHNQGKTKVAVDGVSFAVEQGEILGIVGESGSGKSTMMFALKNLLSKNATVTCDRMEKADGLKMAMVFQDPLSYLNPSMKIGKQITETIKLHQGLSREKAKKEAVELLSQAGIYQGETILKKYPFELSGGMRQRVILAIALAMKPSLLIADEPTTALDVVVQRQILDRIRKIAKENQMAVILVSHDLQVIGTLAERVLVMKEGKVVEEGFLETIFDMPKHSYTKELLAKMELACKMVGNCSEKQVLLETKDLKKSFKEHGIWRKMADTNAVRDVSFHINRGETYGLVGESGCGKTTLARIMTGMITPEEGNCHYYGKNRIQMVFQDPYASLDPLQTIGEILEEPLLLNQIGTRQERADKVEEMLLFIGLKKEDKEKYPFAFSGGERQRIGIARALILEPELIVLDEPVSALDMVIQEQILDLLAKSQKEKGIAYLFISHDLQVVRRMSQRMSVMYAGRLVESGDTRQIYEDPWHPYTKKLLDASLTGDLKKLRKRAKLRLESRNRPEQSSKGCPYAADCSYALECCKMEMPDTYTYGEREIACFLYDPDRWKNRKKDYPMVSQI